MNAAQHTALSAQSSERSVLWTIADTADGVVLAVVVIAVIALLLTRRRQVETRPDGVRRRGWLHRTFIGGWFGMGPDTGRRVQLPEPEHEPAKRVEGP